MRIVPPNIYRRRAGLSAAVALTVLTTFCGAAGAVEDAEDVLQEGEQRKVVELEPPPQDAPKDARTAWLSSIPEERHVRAVRVDKPPVIDGIPNEDIWNKAEDPGPLIQTRPYPGAKPTEDTKFRVLFDSDYLYVAIWCYDSQPERIVAKEMARDGNVGKDDNVIIVLDTFHDLRNGYYFRFNPLGCRVDALITNNLKSSESWDGIWMVRGNVTDKGWTAEVAIPFKTVSFNPNIDTWGFNIYRSLNHKFERLRWSGYQTQVNTYQVSEAGTISGLTGLEQGVGLDIVPYALARYTNNRDPADDDTEIDGGADARYRVLPNLTASVSVNTDFAETEVDSRQVNLTRFPLFFPEKRAFFLEDAGIFEFGGLTSSEFLPFFSRRIGLSENGEPVPIVVASKLTGRVRDYNIGGLQALLEDEDDLDSQNALVGRVSKNVFDQSYIGGLATYGDPNSEDENFVGGGDFGYRASDLFGDQIFEFNTYGLASYTESVENDDATAFGAKFSLPNDTYRVRAEAFQVGEDFDAALGFVPRRGVRSYELDGRYRPRAERIDWIRRVIWDFDLAYFTDLDNEIDSAENEFIPFWIVFESEDEAWATVQLENDTPDEDFEISDGVIISADEYWWYDYRFGVDTSARRPFELTAVYSSGQFYDGDRDRYIFGINVRTVKWVLISTSYSLNKVRLPEGTFDTRVTSTRVQINFTPDVTWSNLLQYDSVSDIVGLNSRFRWEVRPGTNFFVVLNQNTQRSEGRPRVLQTEITVKLRVTFRF